MLVPPILSTRFGSGGTIQNSTASPILSNGLRPLSSLPKGKRKSVHWLTPTSSERVFSARGLTDLGYTVFGGQDSPYLWCKTPNKVSSWNFFDYLLERYQIVSIPGSGFGQSGEGFIRFSGFADPSSLGEALQRLKNG